MNKHKTLPLFWAAFSLLLLFNVMPALAQSTEKAADADTLFNCTWASATVYPATVLDNPCTTVGSFLYSFGGVSTAITANSFKFDGTTWTPIAPLPVAVEFASAVNDGTNIYVMGGAEPTAGTPQTTNRRYDPVANTYTSLAPFTTGTWNHSAVFLGGKIYKFCGTGPGTASTAVTEIYDIASNTWTAGPTYPLAISFVSGWTQGGFIYGAGGIQSVGSVASLKTYRLDPANLGAGWVDAAIADLPATRWGAATAFYSPDVVLAGGYVAGSATANISNTAISYDLPTDSWQMVPNMIGERARMTGAVLGGSMYVVGGRSIASPAFVGTNSNQKLTCLNVPTNILSSGGSSIATGGANGVLDPGETVTVSLGVKNTGGPGVVCAGGNPPGLFDLTGTLLATGGVTAPSAPQNYSGSTGICSGITPLLTTFRYFSFTVDPTLPCGSTVTASLAMMGDGGMNYGTITYSFITGKLVSSFNENFDGVVAPALPAGWTTTFSGLGTAATTSTVFPDTAPNDVFLSEASNVALSEVASPPIAVAAGGQSILRFRNLFNTEPTFDGMVLEIKIGAGAFQDILAAGGSFVSGGYNGTLNTGFANPLPGRMAWNGLSGGTAAAPAYITSVVNLPAAAAGQTIQLMWRMGSDNSVIPATNPGARIDTISIVSPSCTGSAPPLVAGTPFSVLPHGGSGDFNVLMPADVKVSGAGQLPVTGGVECRRGNATATPNVYDYKLIVPFTGPMPVAVGGVTVLTTDGTKPAIATVTGPLEVTVDIPGVVDLPLVATPPGTGAGQVLAVTLTDATNPAGALGNINIQMGLLIGDQNDSRAVDGGDSTPVRNNSGTTVPPSPFRQDMNHDGLILAGDRTIASVHSGNSLP